EVLPSLPRLPNGKIDQGALACRQTDSPSRSEPAAPASETENTLIGIWQEVLGTDQISIHDDFFEIGGDSILSIQVISRARSSGLHIAPQDFAENATIAALAALVAEPPPEALPEPAEPSREAFPHKYLVPIQTSGSHFPLFCMHSGGDALLYRGLSRHLGPDFPVYGLQAIGLTDDEKPAESFGDIARPYLEEVRAVQPRGPYHLLGNCFGAAAGLEMAHELQAQGEEVALLVVVDSAAPGPLPSIWEAVRERNPGRIWRRLKRNVQSAAT
ncbi:MAG: hypothetical protein GWO24_17000, partial [Akkermansiaceae bacterium]|nr:hypothetical protein [Akkermansiaceae bacterium]